MHQDYIIIILRFMMGVTVQNFRFQWYICILTTSIQAAKQLEGPDIDLLVIIYLNNILEVYDIWCYNRGYEFQK